MTAACLPVLMAFAHRQPSMPSLNGSNPTKRRLVVGRRPTTNCHLEVGPWPKTWQRLHLVKDNCDDETVMMTRSVLTLLLLPFRAIPRSVHGWQTFNTSVRMVSGLRTQLLRALAASPQINHPASNVQSTQVPDLT